MYLDLQIAKLLEQHECVIIPDFGAFISNERSLYINETEGRIYPAAKRLAFNPSLVFNDGLLINSISFYEKISYVDAAELVKKSLEQWRKKLADKESLLLVGIGQLKMNDDQKMIFTPLANNNLLPDSFGLPEVEIKAVVRKAPELTSIEKEIRNRLPEVQEEFVEVKPHHKTGKSKKVLYYSLTAYIPIIIGLWAILFFTDPFNRSNESSLNPIEASPKPANEKTIKSDNKAIEKTTNNKIINRTDNIHQTSSVTINTATQSVYYIVGGSFKGYKNAAILQREYLSKNFDSKIVKSANNQYRVAYSKFTNRTEAENFLQSIRQSENSSAWILNESK